ncbi:type IV secretion system DNA-binding domain-containing protein [Arsenophonus endosymbiont of Aleurodicus floccissimus]|uniref:type IV secretion system DNA-binding domain-containing protein n=1 Tax=Arsenophonus endosymbiont of Aleurodicus floccissimus TaxID=2152761 RepID=UPI001EDF2112|nr:type IV secretion system DNA-binding domain-containing protein [Arsenophonus endosymbiont of Aleurodicus floccissimus]
MKSTVINDLLTQVRKQRKRAIVYDKGNNFIPLFYQEGKDIILNPMDARCPNWDL